MNKKWFALVLLGLLVLAPAAVQAQGQTGTLEITGVPADTAAGRYDRQAGVFYADVAHLEGALVKVTLEEVTMVGRKMEWRTEDNYVLFTNEAKLNKEDFELTADLIEYFGDEKKLNAQGSVVVITDEATIYAQALEYDEETDQAIFTGQVRVVFEDGTLEGEKFLMLLEQSELQFFGSFQGEFNTENN